MSTNKKLTLTDKVRADIAAYIKACDYEIGGFGYVTMTDTGDFIVDQVFLVKQTVSGSSVDFMDDGLAYAIDKAATDGRLTDLKFCWHSHVEMGAFWSNTDNTMISGMNNGMTPYIVSLVQNKFGKHEQRVDFFNPAGDLGKMTDQITYDLDLYYETVAIPGHIEKAITDLVEIEKPTVMGFGKGYTYRGPNRGRQISDNRTEFLMEKVAKVGVKGLSDIEATDYEIVIDKLNERTARSQMGTWWEEEDDIDQFMKESGYNVSNRRGGQVIEWRDGMGKTVTDKEALDLYYATIEEQHEVAEIMTGGM